MFILKTFNFPTLRDLTHSLKYMQNPLFFNIFKVCRNFFSKGII